MDLAETFDAVGRIVASSADPAAGVSALLDYLEATAGFAACGPIRCVDPAADVATVRSRLSAVLAAEPPPAAISAYYFGLFDTEDDAGADAIGFYVAGIERFDRDDGDSLCDPAWFPEGRYLSSRLLAAVKTAEIAAGARGHDDACALLGYAGQIGVAALLTKFASAGLLRGAPRVVGFDSGDFLELDAGTAS